MENVVVFNESSLNYRIHYNVENKSETTRNSLAISREVRETRSMATATEAMYAESLIYLDATERSIFFSVFLVVYVICFLGNTAAIYVTWKRKHRYIQKSLIISLALTDLIMATAYTINYLETFSHPLINWTLGSFMCSLIPFFQIFGVVASSAALVAVALDRYRNVIHATKKRWNPNLLVCLLGVAVMWGSSAVSYPISTLFKTYKLAVIYVNDSNVPIAYEHMYLCMTGEKDNLKMYYLCIILLIFLPMFLIFTWLYYNIAKLVWHHRKPLSSKFQDKQEASVETMSSQLKTNESISSSKTFPKAPALKNNTISVERKIRTFKIIIFLMLAFFLCRLPYWTFNVLKLINTYEEHKHWIMTYIFNGLALINCALNPFMYTFLNETVNRLTKFTNVLNDFVCKVCCCCISNTEFDEFERENPFFVGTYERKPISKMENPSHSNSTKRSSKVKFEEIPKPPPMPINNLDCNKIVNRF